MKITISIRLVLYTEMGPVGGRLALDEPLPDYPKSFPDTEQGRIDAEKTREMLQAYIERNDKPENRHKNE